MFVLLEKEAVKKKSSKESVNYKTQIYMQGHLISNWFNSTAVYQEHSLLLEQICNFHNDFSHFMAHALQDMTCRE